MSSLLDLFTPPTTIKSALKGAATSATKKLMPSDASGLQGRNETNDSFRQSMTRESQSSANPRESSSSDKVTSGRESRPRSDAEKVSENQEPDKIAGNNTAPAETNAEKVHAETAVETPVADAPDADSDLALVNAEAAVPLDLVTLAGNVSPEARSSQPAAADLLRGNRRVLGEMPLPVASRGGAEIVVESGDKPVSLLGVEPDALANNKSELAHLFRAGVFKTVVDATQAVPLEKADANTPPALKLAEAPLATIAPGAPVTRNASFAKMLQLDSGLFSRVGTTATSLLVEVPESPASANSGNLHAASPLSAFNMAPTDAVGARMQVPVNITFGQPQWANMVAERSAWLFSQNISSAELMLDPPELGRMSVQIQVHNNEQASVTFTSANHSVRDALDQTTQRLRELLAEQGLDLVNVDVSDRQPSDEQNPQNFPKGGSGTLASDGEAGVGEGGGSAQIMVNVGIDHYV